MKFKRFLPFLLVLVLISVIFTGCGASLKTARVAAKFGKVLKEQPVTSATAEFNCVVAASEASDSVPSRFHTIVRASADWEASRSYSEITTTVNVSGQEMTETMQCYASGESGMDVRYLHADGPDVWVRMANQKRAVDIDPALLLILLDKVSENTTLETIDNSAGGGVHHILRLCFDAGDIWDFAVKAGLTIPPEFEDCDFKDVKVPVELELEDKTYLPIRLQLSVEGINDSLLKALANAAAKGQQIQGLDLEIEEMSLLITNFGYGPQEIPMLPMGAAENALDMQKVKEILN